MIDNSVYHLAKLDFRGVRLLDPTSTRSFLSHNVQNHPVATSDCQFKNAPTSRLGCNVLLCRVYASNVQSAELR